jgi:hypothetical protein
MTAIRVISCDLVERFTALDCARMRSQFSAARKLRNVTQFTWVKARIRKMDASDYRAKTQLLTGMTVALREARRFNDPS